MTDEINKETQNSREESSQQQSDLSESRRRFTKAGMAGTAIFASLYNRSALGTQCTPSILMSGNTSAHPDIDQCLFGCSPGFWKQYDKMGPAPEAWLDVQIDCPSFHPGMNFMTAFNDVLGSFPICDFNGTGSEPYTDYLKSHTVGQVVNADGFPDQACLDLGFKQNQINFLKSVGLHIVAAIANACHPFISMGYHDLSTVVIPTINGALMRYCDCISAGGTPLSCHTELKAINDMFDEYDERVCFLDNNGIQTGDFPYV